MSFPFEVEEGEEITEQEKLPLIEYGIDFETGNLTGKMVEGLEAIKVWIYYALRTDRYRHLVYSWDYGNEIESLISKSYSKEYLDSEIPRMIEECLLIHPDIIAVSNFNIEMEGDKLTGTFHVTTTYGEGEINV